MEFITQCGVPAGPIGQGTWYLGNRPDTFQQELSALRAGIDRGMTLLDTAEMYGEGAAERLLGQAIRGYDREKLYLVSKVYPHNAGRRNIFHSCRQSLKRLDTDYLDLDKLKNDPDRKEKFRRFYFGGQEDWYFSFCKVCRGWDTDRTVPGGVQYEKTMA